MTGGILATVAIVRGALILVATVDTTVTGLALAFVAVALVNAHGVTLAIVVTIALVAIAALVSIARVPVFALALVPVALVDTLGIGVTWVRGALVLVALGNALAILKFEAILAGAGVADALVNAIGIGTAPAVVAIITLISIATLVPIAAVTIGTGACV